jgi:hypothetical protein
MKKLTFLFIFLLPFIFSCQKEEQPLNVSYRITDESDNIKTFYKTYSDTAWIYIKEDQHLLTINQGPTCDISTIQISTRFYSHNINRVKQTLEILIDGIPERTITVDTLGQGDEIITTLTY